MEGRLLGLSLTAPDAALIAAAGFVAGSINAVAGGGSLISFPALMAVGLPPLSANVTNSVGMAPGYLGGTVGYRRELASQHHRIRSLVPVAALGGIAGSIALLTTPPTAFKGLVPFLILLACALLAAQPRIQRWIRGRPHDGIMRSPWALYLTIFVASLYGAYFGGGLGVVLLAVLGIFIEEVLQKLNALKSTLTLTINTIAALIFSVFGPVQWLAVAVVAPAGLLGGYLGASVARHLPAAALRWSVTAFGVTVAVILLVQA